MSAAVGIDAAHSQTQSTMNADTSANYSKADRELNAAYGRVMTKATPSGRTRLRTAQRAWLAFRNANCQAMTGSRNGSAYPMLHAMCMTDMTEARTAELTSQLQCKEGDLSCGGPFEP